MREEVARLEDVRELLSVCETYRLTFFSFSCAVFPKTRLFLELIASRDGGRVRRNARDDYV